MKKNYFISLLVLTLSACTIVLPPKKEESVPAADPVVIPGKTTNKPATGTSTTTTSQETKVSTSSTANIAKSKPVEVRTTTTIANAQQTPRTSVQKSSYAASTQGHTYYIVKPKDTVFKVMRETGVHWKEIIRINRLKPPKYVIHPGQKLWIK